MQGALQAAALRLARAHPRARASCQFFTIGNIFPAIPIHGGVEQSVRVGGRKMPESLTMGDAVKEVAADASTLVARPADGGNDPINMPQA